MTNATTLLHARGIREHHGYSLEQVSRATNITFSHLARFERGLAHLGTKNLKALAAFYSVTIDELLREAEPQEVTP